MLEIIYNGKNKLSPSTRLSLVYIKIVGLIALTSIFSQALSYLQAIMASLATALFLGIPLAILKSLFHRSSCSRLTGTVLSWCVILLSWYMILTVAALLGPNKSNIWGVQFVLTFIID